ncbi:MAG: methylenetetrahydrofolate reductase [Candidatus Azobacteroides sp.]|nr:methylenetetrahydrofolate reductase [Candidatus Azobacteroides sp.]
MRHLKEKILNKESGIILYGLTPPKICSEEEKNHQIATKQIERLTGSPIDGLILYDLQDESARNNSSRPFPFIPTLAPEIYSNNYLSALDVPKIIYKSVSKFTPEGFEDWIRKNDDEYIVFVGAPSGNYTSGISLKQAYEISKKYHNSFVLGGVTIPERHSVKKNEHIRVCGKIESGCHFFISQCVYDVNGTKNFLSDYYYNSINNNKELVPIIFSLTPCGSRKTLEFMKWLGIQIPDWLENDLSHSNNILSSSLKACKNIATELIEYCSEKNIPIGFNIESIAIRKEEIDASIELLHWFQSVRNEFK